MPSIITVTVFVPLLGAIALGFLPQRWEAAARWVAAGFALLAFALSIVALISFDRSSSDFQLLDQVPWVNAGFGSFRLQYLVGVDGLSLPLVLLTSFLTLVSVLISFHVELRPRLYFGLMLVLETGVLGVFTSLDLLLFFLFWEVELMPMYLLISIWGTGRKEYAAMKFLIYTIAGSALMLVGLLALGFTTGTFDVTKLSVMSAIKPGFVPLALIFWLIFAAFAVKLPVFPLHTWLPDAHTDAPTAVSVLLAGVLLKMGGYGMLRFCITILPKQAQQFALVLAILAAINIIYGAFVVMRQRDLKRLIAYSSVSHMGYVLLGLAALRQVGLTGASLQMVSHGLITGLLFVLVGLVYERTHTRQIGDMSGLARRLPLIAVVFVVAGFASLGLPSLSGFVAELLVFLGTFERFIPMTALGIFGIVLSAGYILWMLQRVLFGPAMERWDSLVDATQWWERVPLAAMVAAIFFIGLWPAFFVDMISKAVEQISVRLG
ncbi:MAG TPA: NADH-quinone oxidoreductase subunit M [Dehalococcoidia bacterium]|nr:NADH-quinone oxidoreductase subunit M [Dehalococcoidia bacterium]